MLFWALAFLVAAFVAAIFAFGAAPIATAGIAKTISLVFAAMFLVFLLGGLFTGRRPPTPSI